MQLTHYTSNFSKRKFPITVVGDHVTNAPNIGSLFRMCDAFGVEKLILCGDGITLGRKTAKTSRATEKVVPYEICESAISVIKSLKKDHYIIALEITNSSQPIHNFQFPKDQPIALVVGDENFGVSDAILEIADAVIHIDMFGHNSSMNVVQATNIAIYEITKQLL
ncbi:TrmH family RNA methyltransferase [Aestuariibaculum suncheonense]|uniref:TrmH family RNA methyltransferase n=1 Tax=Aestuariibaculum suncheonense TaxID=1028745 RepID=A0A8J6Q5N0_9FLAO|nr:TrmH family RNA methyltransferase [Aestuariibaculum suncheonense]MBD0835373.1 TrmH family RNA methyltransferase [Aestuariibaculum suncheonense]